MTEHRQPRPGPAHPNPARLEPAPVGPRRLRLVPPDQRRGPAGKVIGVANAGPRVPVGIALADTRHHLHVLGPTGTGKSTLLLRMILADATAGRGVAVFDPKGDLIRDVLDRLPAGCADRLVIIDPDDHHTAPPALNLLDPATAGGSAQRAADQITTVMAKVWARWWGHRTADIAHHALLTLAHTPRATLTDLPRLLADTAFRVRTVNRVRARLGQFGQGTLGDFWDSYEQLTASERAQVVAPLLAKLRLVLAHPLAVDLFGTPATTFTLADILDGGILLVRLPKDAVGDDGCRLIGSLLLAGLWRASTARTRLPEHDRLDAAVVVDECHNFVHLPIGVDDALAEARGLRVSFVLAHQYLGQLTAEMAAAVDANARNKVYFSLAPKDAAHQAEHVRPYLDAGDLVRLGGYEIVLRPVAAGRTIPPCTLDALPPPPPVEGRAETLRAAAGARTGLDRQHRQQLLAARRTHPTPEGSAAGEPVELPTSHGQGRSLGPSLDPSPAPSPGLDQPGDQPTPTGTSPQVTIRQEDPWTGPDW